MNDWGDIKTCIPLFRTACPIGLFPNPDKIVSIVLLQKHVIALLALFLEGTYR